MSAFKLKTPEEIETIREGGKRLAFIMAKLAEDVYPGMSSLHLDKLAEDLISRYDGTPSFKNYKTPDDPSIFPSSLCVSVNDEVVHGIPSAKKILKEGQIVSLDLGMQFGGMYTDMAVTVPVGKVSEKAMKIIEAAKRSLEEGIKMAINGGRMGDIGFAVQTCAKSYGFDVVRNLVGHGVGHEVHEDPQIPNFGIKGKGIRLETGMVLAVEPMITEKSPDVCLGNDDWVWKTSDGGLASHWEHTVAITENGPEVLTR